MAWRGLPVFGLFLGVLAAAMLGPAAFALALGDRDVAAAFGYGALVTAAAGAAVSVAMRGRAEGGAFGEFGALLAILTLGPAAAAAPLAMAEPRLGFEAAWFEMVSMLTTTGATVFDRPSEAHPAVLIWRAAVAWLGGLTALVAAWSVLAPRGLGGFEVRAEEQRSAPVGRLAGSPAWAGGRASEAASDRLAAAMGSVLPVYLGLTIAVALVLAGSGAPATTAVAVAAGLLSTTGVAMAEGPALAAAGAAGEAAAAAALALAVSRHVYGGVGAPPFRLGEMRRDPETRLLAAAVLVVTALLWSRHFFGALDLPAAAEDGTTLRTLWGAFFTTLSFATTTGYVSVHWEAARSWSGLDNPSLVFLGLAAMGGGVATTAGGIKLLRAYALLKHGARELEKLVSPASVGGRRDGRRSIRREGAQIAWVFVMLYVVTLAATMLAVALTGIPFFIGLAASVAALSNTGPLLGVTTGASWLTDVKPEGRAILAAAMIVGRVEILALVAMLNRDTWR